MKKNKKFPPKNIKKTKKSSNEGGTVKYSYLCTLNIILFQENLNEKARKHYLSYLKVNIFHNCKMLMSSIPKCVRFLRTVLGEV
jgi:hypothetical protein